MMKVKSESEVAQSCPTLNDPMDCSPPGSSVHGIFQVPLSMEISRQECWRREWVAFPFSRGFPDPGIKPGSPALQADSLLSEPPGKPMFGVLALYHIYNSNYFLTSSRLLFNFVDFFS